MEQRIGLDRELVVRQVFGREGQRLLEIRARGVEALPRQAVHQVEIQVVETRGAREFDCAAGVGGVVHAAERGEHAVVEALHADRQAVDTGGAVVAVAAGVNRLSIGVQSFDDRMLAALGRVHDAAEARRAIELARAAGFDNLNLDLMYGLPGQSLDAACADLEQALALAPEHLSHYQLTIEPNTLFHHRPPAGLPDDELAWRQQRACQARLAAAGYDHYEVSAWARPGREARHNLNYWHFGDYIGIGAGAHGKLTLAGEARIVRRVRVRQPRAYLAARGSARVAREIEAGAADLVFEFMLNATRLVRGFDPRLFHRTTGLGLDALLPRLNHAKNKGLVDFDARRIRPTELGFRFLNDLQALFLDVDEPRRRPIFESGGEIMHN